MKRLIRFFRELRRRRVFRVALVYCAVGWPVIEFSSYMVSKLRLPGWTSTFVLMLVIAGFPLALVLAWAFEVTSEGVLRDSQAGSQRRRPEGSPRRGAPPKTSPADGAGGPSPASQDSPPDRPDTYDGETVRFSTPSHEQGTFQLLPGRLEILEGVDRGEDIHFEAPGSGPLEFTFGRSQNPEPTHIQLKDRTVSREHAVMNWRDEEWEIENRSSTNPLRVNGRQLSEVGDSTTLSDGDTIEMGTLTFRYRED